MKGFSRLILCSFLLLLCGTKFYAKQFNNLDFASTKSLEKTIVKFSNKQAKLFSFDAVDADYDEENDQNDKTSEATTLLKSNLSDFLSVNNNFQVIDSKSVNFKIDYFANFTWNCTKFIQFRNIRI